MNGFNLCFFTSYSVSSGVSSWLLSHSYRVLRTSYCCLGWFTGSVFCKLISFTSEVVLKTALCACHWYCVLKELSGLFTVTPDRWILFV